MIMPEPTSSAAVSSFPEGIPLVIRKNTGPPPLSITWQRPISRRPQYSTIAITGPEAMRLGWFEQRHAGGLLQKSPPQHRMEISVLHGVPIIAFSMQNSNGGRHQQQRCPSATDWIKNQYREEVQRENRYWETVVLERLFQAGLCVVSELLPHGRLSRSFALGYMARLLYPEMDAPRQPDQDHIVVMSWLEMLAEEGIQELHEAWANHLA